MPREREVFKYIPNILQFYCLQIYGHLLVPDKSQHLSVTGKQLLCGHCLQCLPHKSAYKDSNNIKNCFVILFIWEYTAFISCHSSMLELKAADIGSSPEFSQLGTDQSQTSSFQHGGCFSYLQARSRVLWEFDIKVLSKENFQTGPFIYDSF